LIATSKEADIYFQSALLISFFLFAMEVFFGSIVLEDFKYSFFFYLDIIATLSLINDISWLLNPLVGLVGSSPDYEGVNAVPGVMYT
jgi:hypothetical protein